MTDELQEKLDEGSVKAKSLVWHVEDMGAEYCCIPVVTDQGSYEVTVQRVM